LAPAGGRVEERGVVADEAELREGGGVDRPVLDRDLHLLSGPVVDDGQRRSSHAAPPEAVVTGLAKPLRRAASTPAAPWRPPVRFTFVRYTRPARWRAKEGRTGPWSSTGTRSWSAAATRRTTP